MAPTVYVQEASLLVEREEEGLLQQDNGLDSLSLEFFPSESLHHVDQRAPTVYVQEASLLVEREEEGLLQQDNGLDSLSLEFFPSESLHHVDQRSPLISAC